jgi:hypothetical protein
MAQDRGGLRYAIQLRDEFSKSIKSFRDGIKGAKREFADLKKTLETSSGSAKSFKETKKVIDENRAALKKLDADAKAQAKRESELNRIRASLRKDEAREEQRLATIRRQNATESNKAIAEQQKKLKAFFDARNRAEREAAKISSQIRRDQAAELTRQQKELKTNLDARARTEKEAGRIKTQQLKDEQRQLQAFVQARARAEKEAAKISASMAKDADRRKKADPEFQAQQRNLKALREEHIVRTQINQLRQKASTQFASGDLLGGTKTLKQVDELKRSLDTIDRSGNNIFFTFRRLVGILAVFTIARNVVQSFNDMVRAALEFNDKVASAEISISGLIAATADVRDQFGRSVDSAQELALATTVARSQVKLLRQDALRTTATFEQLLDTFQVAIAPGFTAGLNIDEIRKLTVSVSQAASAIGVEQNQLAEEIRSLLSGTIQARTTRIATALGISNADIRRLKETGKLFDFLEAKFKTFGEAAEKQAQSTLSGIKNLVTDAVQALLGEAAQPLFNELLSLGKAVFNQVLTIRNELGELKPNPKAVAAFKVVFDALTDGVKRIRDVATSVGFEGAISAFRAVGAALSAAIQFAIGFAQTFLVTLRVIVGVVRSIADFFGLTTKQLGQAAAALGIVLASTVVWNNTLGLIGLNFRNILGFARSMIPALGALLTKLEAAGGAAATLGRNIKAGALGILGLAATLAVALEGFRRMESAIFQVDLSLKETIQITLLALVQGIAEAEASLVHFGLSIGHSIEETGLTIGQKLRTLIQGSRVDIAAIKGDFKEVERLVAEQLQIERGRTNDKQKRDQQFTLEIETRKNEALAKQKALQEEIAKIVGEASAREAQGTGFNPDFDLEGFLRAKKEAAAAGKEFTPIISSADTEIQALAEDLLKLQDELRAVGIEFKNVKKTAGLGGTAGQIEGIFTQTEIANAERLKKIQQALKKVNDDINIAVERNVARNRERLELSKQVASEENKNRLAALDAEGKQDNAVVTSLLRDRADLTEAILESEKAGLDIATKRAAILALEATADVNKSNKSAQAELAAEQALLTVQQLRLGARRQAIVEAENAINLARTELAITTAQKQAEINAEKARADKATGEDADALNAHVLALQSQLELEQQIAAVRLKSLEIARQEAALRENASITEGFKRGLADIALELPTAFEAGINIARGMVTQFASFVTEAIGAAFDPNADGSVEEKFGRLLQSIAQLILQNLVEVNLAKLLGAESTATVEVTSATTAAGIRTAAALEAAATEIAAAETAAAIKAATSFAASSGGVVPQAFASGGRVLPDFDHFSRRAEGLARGGRPKHIPQSDTVPAWLTPGEFVVRKSVVKSMGLDFFKKVNQGRLRVPSSSIPTPEHASAGGMARGGLVSTGLRERQRAPARSHDDQGTIQVLPVQVTSERALDRQMNGGRNAFLRFMRENASTVRGIINTGKK